MIFRYISILAIMVLAAACDTSEKLEYRPDDSPNRVSIAYLKSLYRSQPVRIAEDISIYGFVTANDDNGNLYKAICLADSTGGIMLRLDAERLYRRFWTGAAVTVRCNGLWIGSYGGMLELGTAPTSGYEVDPTWPALKYGSTGYSSLQRRSAAAGATWPLTKRAARRYVLHRHAIWSTVRAIRLQYTLRPWPISWNCPCPKAAEASKACSRSSTAATSSA